MKVQDASSMIGEKRKRASCTVFIQVKHLRFHDHDSTTMQDLPNSKNEGVPRPTLVVPNLNIDMSTSTYQDSTHSSTSYDLSTHIMNQTTTVPSMCCVS